MGTGHGESDRPDGFPWDGGGNMPWILVLRAVPWAGFTPRV